MKRTILALLTLAALLAAANQKRTFTGVITDSMCGRDHRMMKITPDSKCATECVKSSAAVKFALFDGQNAYKLSDQQTPQQYLLNDSRISCGSPGGAESKVFRPLLNEIRQGRHLAGATDTVAQVVEEVHPQFPGRAQERLKRVPSFGSFLRPRSITHHPFAHPSPCR